MILYTIQKIEAWDKLQENGYLRTDPQYIDRHHLTSYKWLARQMHERLGFRPSGDLFPLWAWYQWEGPKKRKPDLRSAGRYFFPKGEKGVRIEFEMEEDQVLLSDFELWHYVLNYFYLPSSEADGERFESELERHGLSFFETKPLPDLFYHKKIEESWTRIFDMEWSAESITIPEDQKVIQANFWELSLSQIRDITEFTVW